jgi:uncharacterized protein (TIGR03118 family)
MHASGGRALRLESLEPRLVLSTSYIARDLVSDQAGVAPVTDTTLVNAWGLAVGGSTGNFWVSSTESGISEVYNGDVNGSPLVKNSLEVTIPEGEPTGQVFNSTTDFVVHSGAASGPALFIFASEEGIVSGWNPAVPPPAPSTSAQTGFEAIDGANYKGIALANNGSGNFLYVTDFHNGKIDVLDANYNLVHLAGSFTDPKLPAGYAPFGIMASGSKVYVTYAQQDADKEDDVAGAGKGFVDVYDTNGALLQRLVSHGKLNAPWGMTVAPANFGDFSGDLLVGNFGDGKINAYNATTGAFQGTLSSSPGHAVSIDGLWGLAFGNGNTAGDATTLYYSAGPDDESHGLFGKITANAKGTVATTAALNGDVLEINGAREADHVFIRPGSHHSIVVEAEGKKVGQFPKSSVASIVFHGFAGNDDFNIAGSLKIANFVDGGAGNDSLHGGAASSILLGGAGNDFLYGGGARDLLIGGEGRDQLFGNSGEDILIGGRTAHDGNDAALNDILAAWNANLSYATRVNNIRTGAGGVPALNDTTVIDDATADKLFGNGGQDWFFKSPGDTLADALTSNSIPVAKRELVN